MPPASDPVEHYGAIVGLTITVAAALWAVVRFLLRPLLDVVVFEAWKRKAPEAEKFMRAEMFVQDLASVAELRALVDQGARIAASTAQSVATLTLDVGRCHSDNRAMSVLLQGIPHLASELEHLAESVDRMHVDLRETNAIARENGETLSAHSALLGERRLQGRRVTDPQHGGE